MLVTLDTYAEVMPKLSKATELVVDLETSGLRPWHGDRVSGVAIHHPEIGSFYFPFGHGAGPNLPPEKTRDFRGLLSNPNVTYVGFNYKFDMGFLYAAGIPLPRKIEDPMLAAHLMNENEYLYNDEGKVVRGSGGRPRTNFQLEWLAQKYLGKEYVVQQEKLRQILQEHGLRKGEMWKLPAELVHDYAIEDVQTTLALRDFYVPHLKTWKLYDLWQEVNRYSLITAKMEIRGMQLDRERIYQYMEEARRMVEPTKAKLQEMAGYGINPDSPKQLQAWLNIDSTRREVLEELIDQGHPLSVAMQTLLDYRGWSKVENTYYQPYLDLADANGVLHPNLSLIGTFTGRLSSFEPNMQAVPRSTKVYKVKDVYVARPGYVLVSADYSQAEVRLATHYSKDEEMKRIILEGVDWHSATAEALDIPRQQGKTLNFSVIYGIGAKALAESLKIPESQAKKYLDGYHSKYPGFRRLYQAAERTASERGYIRMYTGRIRRYDKLNPTHKASSNLIQGGVAEIVREAITKLDDVLEGTDTHQLLQVHDQIVFEVPEDRLFKILPVIKETMEDFSFEIPMKVDIGYGPTWMQLTEWDPEEAV